MKSIEARTPPNLGWLEVSLSSEEVDYLWGIIGNKGEDVRSTLAGNLSSSCELIDEDNMFFNNVCIPCLKMYEQEFEDIDYIKSMTSVNNRHFPLYLSSFWVNNQKQTEFNPNHNHTGIFSFVIWMKIPTDWAEQSKLPFVEKSNNPAVVSNFVFHYQDILGRSEGFTYTMNPSIEGNMVFFPSRLNHSVYPFYNCDEERITISGNISLNAITPPTQ